MNAVEQVSVKVREAFNFTVDKFPLSGPDGLKTPWYGLFRSDNGEPVGAGSVTSVYYAHQTDDVAALVEAAAHAFDGEIDCRCYFRNGHYVSVMPTRDYRRTVCGTDAVWPRLMIRAGYDAKAFHASVGYYRDLCKNLSIMKMVKGTSVSIRHTGGLRDRMDDLLNDFRSLKEGWTTLTNVIAEMENRKVRMADFVRAVYGEPEEGASHRTVTTHRRRTEKIFRRLRRESLNSGRGDINDQFEVSAWMAFNAIQGYVQHDMTRHGNPSEWSRVLSSLSDPAVVEAERLALAA
jgi:hypothetical protein